MANSAYLRAFVCLVFGSLALVQVASAQTGSNLPFGEYMYQKNTWERFWFSGMPRQGYNPVPTNLPVPSSTPVGNYDLGFDANGKPEVRTKTPFQFPESHPDVADVRAKFKMRDLAGALGRFANKVLTPLALGNALFDLARELGFWVTRNPDGSLKWEKDGYDPALTPYFSSGNPPVTGSTIEAVCLQAPPEFGTFTGVDTNGLYGDLKGRCQYTSGSNISVFRCTLPQGLVNGICQTIPLGKIPATQQEFEDAVTDKPSYPPSSRLLDAIRDAIKNEPDPDKRPKLDDPTVTGPSSSTKPKETVTNKPDGSTETKVVTNNYNYQGNSVSNTTTTVINNYNPVTNITTTTTTTNNSPNPEPPKDFCELHPDSPACSEMDTPEGEIPKKTENITYAAENLFGGGACPAPKTFTYFGHQHSLSYQGTCDALANYVRYIVIAAASFAAYLMILAALRK